MKTTVVLMVLLGVQCFMAGFPYTVKFDPPEVTPRKPLQVYSVLMVTGSSVVYTYLYSLVVPGEITREKISDLVLDYIKSYSFIVAFMVTFLYGFIYRSKLRRIVDTAVQLHASLKDSLTDRLDWNSLAALGVTGIIVVYLTFVGGDFTSTVPGKVMSFLSALIFIPTTSLTPLMYNSFLKLSTTYLIATFKHIQDSILLTPADTLLQQNPGTVTSKRDCKLTESSVSWSGSALTVSNFESARRRLYVLDQLVMDVNEHFGPPICVTLGTELLLVISFLHDVILSNELFHISVAFFLLGCLRISVTLNAPGSFTKQVSKVLSSCLYDSSNHQFCRTINSGNEFSHFEPALRYKQIVLRTKLLWIYFFRHFITNLVKPC